MNVVDVSETSLARVEVDRVARVVRLIRKPEPLDVAALRRAVDDFQLMVPLRERPRLALLQDMRLAPMVRDEALEQAIMEELPRLSGKFAARAVLIATPVGRLQVNRFTSTAEASAPPGSATVGGFQVFLDEVEAERFIAGEAAKLRAQFDSTR